MKVSHKMYLLVLSSLLSLSSSCEYDPDNSVACLSYSAVIYNSECGCGEDVEWSCIRSISITKEQYDCLKKVLETSSGSCYFFDSHSCLPGEEGGYLASVNTYQDFIQEVFCIE